PRYETCLEAVRLALAQKVEFLLAVGGGSVLDASKFIAAAACYRGRDPWQILKTEGAVVKEALPLGAVLTLPATGSEMNAFSVISRQQTQEKLHFGSEAVFPRFSILDPQVTYSLPRRQLRNGIVDAFVHVMEQYATSSKLQTPLQDRQAEAVISTLMELAPPVLRGRKNYDSRADLMWCATQALNGVIGCGAVEDWATHMIGHELTAFFGVAHAESLAIVLPGVWRNQLRYKQKKLARMAERVWNIRRTDVRAAAEGAIRQTVRFFHSLDMPTRLRDYGIDKRDLRKVVDRFAARGTVLGERQNIKAPQIGRILESCW
ncbi:MAG: iron-containing alcohol dehydrogenase, partial [Sedimentisphaerales bacterium]|nr:iron-containing alcohol dehydrogenase [Sedimentisphaerales bacterium]